MKPELWSIKFAVLLDFPRRDEAVPPGGKMRISPILERPCFLPIHWLASSAGASECGIINETGRTSPDSHKGLQIERRLRMDPRLCHQANGWRVHLGYQFHVIPNSRRRGSHRQPATPIGLPRGSNPRQPAMPNTSEPQAQQQSKPAKPGLRTR